MPSEDYPYCKDAIVQIGPDRWVTLHMRVGMIPGVGQVWLTTKRIYVLSQLDIRGNIVWSIVIDAVALYEHFGVRYEPFKLTAKEAME